MNKSPDYPQDDYMYEPPTVKEESTPSRSKSKKEEKQKYLANFPDLIDLVEYEGETKFLLKDGSIANSIEIRGKECFPPNKERLAFDLPNYDKIEQLRLAFLGVSSGSGVSRVSGVCSEVFEEIEKYHKESAEVPDERLNILITAWDIHTHFLEHFYYSPILFLAGLPEKGKSRLAKSMIAVSKRGVIKASVTDAQIIREASDQGATIFFDMTNFWDSIQKAGSMDVILSRYERGLKVARVLNPEKGAFEDMTYFDVFGPTIVASNETVEQVLGSRMISFIMRESKKEFPDELDEKKGKELREKIVAIKILFPDLKFPQIKKIVKGRFGDIIRTLHRVIKVFAPDKEQTFIELVEDLQKKRKANMAQTIEGEIVLAILELKDEVLYGALAVKLITNKINQEKSEKEKFTYQRIGRRLDIMGYQKTTTSNNLSAIVWNEELNETLALEHNVEGGTKPIETPKAIETPKSQGNARTPTTNTISNNINNNNDIINKAKEIFEEEKFDA